METFIPTNKQVIISRLPLDIVALNRNIQFNQGESGASVIFTGNVRVSDEEQGLTGMTMEHYPGMTESLLDSILDQAIERWQLNRVLVAHRVGRLAAGDPIVFVGTCSLHRKQAFEAAEFIMDYLKNKATFWKKEHYSLNESKQDISKQDSSIQGRTIQDKWVESKRSDLDALKRW